MKVVRLSAVSVRLSLRVGVVLLRGGYRGLFSRFSVFYEDWDAWYRRGEELVRRDGYCGFSVKCWGKKLKISIEGSS